MPDFMAEPVGIFLAVTFFSLANAFFVGAEYALVKVRGLGRGQPPQNDSGAVELHRTIQQDINTYLATCQLGTTMASLGLGWVLSPAVATLFSPLFAAFDFTEGTLHRMSFLIGFLVFSALHVVVGQQIPKTIAILKPKPVTLALVYPLHVFYLLCHPLVRSLTWVSDKMVSWLGLAQERPGVTPNLDRPSGLSVGVRPNDAKWQVEAESQDDFWLFDHRPVKRAMIPRSEVVHLRLDWPIEEVLRIITTTGHARLPLIEGEWETVLGVVKVQEILSKAAQSEELLAKIRSSAKDPLTVPESEHVAKLFRRMRAKRAPMALVVDEYGEYVGVVTIEDLLDEAGRFVFDEPEENEAVFGIRCVGSGWEAHGLAPLGDIGRITGFFPQLVDANTLSGFFMKRLERMPVVGDIWEENGFRLTVRAVQERHVELCELVKLPD